MNQVRSLVQREWVVWLASFALLVAVILGAAVFAGLLDTVVAAQSAATLTAKDHPSGTRFLEDCTIKAVKEECVSERVIVEWSPSGRFVKLAVVGFMGPGEWKLPRQVRVVEMLEKPKVLLVDKKLPEMTLSDGGKVRWQ